MNQLQKLSCMTFYVYKFWKMKKDQLDNILKLSKKTLIKRRQKERPMVKVPMKDTFLAQKFNPSAENGSMH